MSDRVIRQVGKFDPVAHARVHGIECPEDECCVQQQFGPEVDVNAIVKRFAGGSPPVVRTDGFYGDFTGVTDFHSALERIEAAKRDFMALDPEVRERYGNDPGRFLNAVQGIEDPERLQDLVRPRKRPSEVSEGGPSGDSPAPGDSGASGADSGGGGGES